MKSRLFRYIGFVCGYFFLFLLLQHCESSTAPEGSSLSVSENSIDFGILYTERSLAIQNQGTDPLDWSLVHKPSWLKVEPSHGLIPERNSSDVNLIVDRHQLDNGKYSGNLVFQANDNDKIVTINLKVNGPVFKVSSKKLDFQKTVDSMQFELSNIGNGMASFKAVTGEAWFSVEPENGYVGADPLMITVKANRDAVSDSDPGIFSNQLSIIPTDPSVAAVHIDIVMEKTDPYT